MKICSKCKIEKEITDFNKSSRNIDGLRYSCRECDKKVRKIYNENNRDKIIEGKKRYRENNRDKIIESKKRYKIEFEKYQKNYEKGIIDNKTEKCCSGCKITKPIIEFYFHNAGKCKECVKKSKKEYRENYPEKRKETKDKWNKNNIEKVKEYKKRTHKRRMERDHLYRVITVLRYRINNFLKRKNISKRSSLIKIIGLNEVDFRGYIENKFTEGMTWENYGWHGWHIDHIIPLSSAKTEEEAYKLCHYTNLQPLWKQDNFNKSNKIL
jgi:hypothetical protein